MITPERLRVLLFSPVADRDPPSGDVSYTEALLAQPPPGVEYRTYAAAIDDGDLRVRGRRPKHGSSSAQDLALLPARAVELGARSAGLMYHEPAWYVSLRPGEFDLVHQHTFAVRQVGHRLPVVTSAGYPLSTLYSRRDGWPAWRTTLADRLEDLFGRVTGVERPAQLATAGTVTTVYSEAYRQVLLRKGFSPLATRVISTGLQDLGDILSAKEPKHLGFVGRDFKRKGGDIALDALRLLRRDDPDYRLSIVTSAHADGIDRHRHAAGVTWHLSPNRQSVLRDVLARTSVLLAPTLADCGAPYGVLEALQLRTPVVLSTSEWLDERLRGPAIRRTPPSAEAVASAVLDLDRHAPGPLGAAARDLWADSFSMTALGQALRDAYDAAVQHGSPRR